MKNLCKNSKRLLSIVIVSLFIGQQSLIDQAVATDITNVQGNNGVYNISPTAVLKNTDIGLRKYQNFELSKGDIANLIYKYGAKDVNTFLNLVDNTIKINGIVNTMRDGNFYNGKAVFISPKGMVVGASGVLNVGSLGVYTPNTSVYNNYKNNPSKDYSVLADKNNVGTGAVKIDGHVFAANDIDVVSSRVQVPGKMLAGTGNNSAFDLNKNADSLFNSIVNTANINSANQITSKNGVISFASTIGTVVSGDVQNVGTGSTNISNSGASGIHISGNLVNHNGSMNITNTAGTVYGAKTATLNNSGGTLKIDNSGNGINFQKNSIITNKGSLDITNTGNSGTTLGGSIQNYGNTVVNNKAGALSVAGNLTNNGSATLTNSGTQLNISGDITNTDGILKLNNSGSDGLNIISTAKINSKGLEAVNTGAKGLNITGNITNNGSALISNKTGGTNGLNIGGTVKNQQGVLSVVNEGADGLKVNYNAKVISENISKDSLVMENYGEGGMYIRGDVNTIGNASYKNTGNKGLNVFGKTNTTNGNTTWTNDGKGGLNVYGSVKNTGGKTTMINNGEKGFNVDSHGLINVDSIDITNNGNDGLNVRGTVDIAFDGKLVNNGQNGISVTGTIDHGLGDNQKTTLYMENNGRYGLNIRGNVNSSSNINMVSNTGSRNGVNIYGKVSANDININNTGYIGINVREGGVVESDNLTLHNDGANGINIKGTVKNTANLNWENNGGFIKVHESGLVENKGNVNFINKGNNGIVIAGNFDNEGNVKFVNDNGPLSVCGKYSNKGDSTFTNNSSQLNISGNVKNEQGKLTLVNNGQTGIHIISTSNVKADDLRIENTGAKGININGSISSDNDIDIYSRGANGTFFNSKADVKALNDINIDDSSENGINIWGLLNAGNDINIKESEADVTIGDMSANNNYLTAGRDITIDIENGNVKNYGVKKTLINAGRDINIYTKNGKVGESDTVVNSDENNYKYRALNVKAGGEYTQK